MAKVVVRDWTKQIVKRTNSNIFPNGATDESLTTTDFVSIKSWSELKDLTKEERQRTLTDFAILNGAYQDVSHKKNDKFAGGYWLRTSASEDCSCIYNSGIDSWHNVYYDRYGACPGITLVFPSKITARNISRKVGPVKIFEENGKERCLVEIGEYPKTMVSSSLNSKLNEMYNCGDLRKGITCTGRIFTTNGQELECGDFLSKLNPEFEYNGEKYVLCTVPPTKVSTRSMYNDGTYLPYTGVIQWLKVEPVSFIVENYDEVKRAGTKRLELECVDIPISGLPYYPDWNHNNSSMWQNSLIRAFLNSAKSSELDGNPDYVAYYKWDFTKSGFLHQALNMTRGATRVYTVPETEKTICERAFAGCLGLEKIIVPSHVTDICHWAFVNCNNASVEITPPKRGVVVYRGGLAGNFEYVYLSKDGAKVILTQKEDKSLAASYLMEEFDSVKVIELLGSENYRRNYIQLKDWKERGIVKFIPPKYTLRTFPASDIKNYFINNNNQRWGKLVKMLRLDTLSEVEKNNFLADLMKIYYAIGGFSTNQGESERAFEYVLNHVAKSEKGECYTPIRIGAEMHERFSKLNIELGYNPTFAKFFMKYYHKNPAFMTFRLYDKDGDLMAEQDYLCQAHNCFGVILKNYPNMEVSGNSRNSLLTPKFVAEHSSIVSYDNVEVGNEKLAQVVGRYGYSQSQFEYMQELLARARQIKDKCVLKSEPASIRRGISFRILEKDDPLGFVIGDITNCCQHIGGNGGSCVVDGFTNLNSGFLVFEDPILDDNGNETDEYRILAQAYIWYDPQTKTVCYDNIEIPKKIIGELKSGENGAGRLTFSALMDAVEESAGAIICDMNRNGILVERVTTGLDCNDLELELETRFGAPEYGPKAKHRNYGGYSDATRAQIVLKEYYDNTKKLSEEIVKTSGAIYSDLKELQTVAEDNAQL